LSVAVISLLRNLWNGAKCLSLNRGKLNDDEPYLRSVVLHQWLFGYELPDTVMLLRDDGHIWILATKKKCDFFRPAVDAAEDGFTIHLLERNKGDSNAENYETLFAQATISTLAAGAGGENDENEAGIPKIGILIKERSANKENGGMLGPWEQKLDEASAGGDKTVELVDIAPSLALVMGQKDEVEVDLMKKSSVLSNKVMKHGFVKRLEEIIEEETKITHEVLATEMEAILEDPQKIKLKVPSSDVQSCYFPIIQSGGTYDIRVSAQSTDDPLSHDIITVSMGARYKLYCSNIARTFLVDPPKKVSETYEILLEVQEACLEAMKPGSPLKGVYKAAVTYLQKNGHDDLVPKLPKNLGFSQGLDFRDSTLTLSAKNNIPFKQGMVFCLAVGFSDLELSERDRNNTPSNSSVRCLNFLWQ
jgi:nucleosome binding factor SPN SPT16 subunit